MLRIILACFLGTAIFAIATFKGLSEYSVRAAESGERVIKITAHKFDYTPNQIHLKKAEPVILEFTSSDVDHGFNVPDLSCKPMPYLDRLRGCALRRRKLASSRSIATTSAAWTMKPWAEPLSWSSRWHLF